MNPARTAPHRTAPHRTAPHRTARCALLLTSMLGVAAEDSAWAVGPPTPLSICPDSAVAASLTASGLYCSSYCEVVTIAGSTKINCDMAALAGTSVHGNAWAVAVHDTAYGGPDPLCGGGEYCIWGMDSVGNDFQCSFDTFSDTLAEIRLVGGDGNDKLFFWYSTTSNPSLDYNLSDYGAGPFVGRMVGGLGDDVLQGSTYAGSEYKDIIHGGKGDDGICAFDGADEAFGDANADDVDCGDGDDVCSGGTGPDNLCGGVGDDSVLGGSQNDLVFGGTGSAPPEDVHGGLGSDECDGSPLPSDCEAFVDSCPW